MAGPTVGHRRGLRRLYADLGRGLLERQRPSEAATAISRALDERGRIPRDSDLHWWLALAEDRAGRGASAFDHYLRAAVGGRFMAGEGLRRAHALLTDETVLEIAGPEDDAAATDLLRIARSNRLPKARLADIEILLARLSIFRMDNEAAVSHVEHAVEADRRVRDRAPDAFRRSALPLRMRSAEGSAYDQFSVARIWTVLGLPSKALKAIDRAIAATDGPADGVHLALRADLLARLGRDSEASEATFEAACAFASTDQHDAALGLFERASERGFGDAALDWWWADSLRVTSSIETPPYLDGGRLAASLRILERGLAQRAPTPAEAWVYLVGALIQDGLGRVTPKSRDAMSAALIYILQGLLCNDGLIDGWSTLGRLETNLGAFATARWAAQRSVDANPSGLVALRDRAMVFAEVLDDGARDAIAEYANMEGSDTLYATSLAAYVDVYDDRPAEAIPVLDRMVRAQPTDLWTRAIRGRAHLLVGDRRKSRSDYGHIWRVTMPGEPLAQPGNRSLRAWAAYRLGHFDAAIAECDELVENESDPFELLVVSALAYLRNGNVSEAERRFSTAFPLLRTHRQVEQTRDDLTEAAGRIGKDSGPRAQFVARLQRRLQTASDHLPDLSAHASVVAELTVLADQRTSGKVEWEAAAATLGLVAGEQNDWDQAASRFRSILAASTPPSLSDLTEVRTALIRSLERSARDQVLNGNVDGADRTLEELRHLGAITRWKAGLQLAEAAQSIGHAERALAYLSEVEAKAPAVDDRAAAAIATINVLLTNHQVEEASQRASDIATSTARWPVDRQVTFGVQRGLLFALSGELASAAGAIGDAIMRAATPDLGVDELTRQLREPGLPIDSRERYLTLAGSLAMLRARMDVPESIRRRLIAARLELARFQFEGLFLLARAGSDVNPPRAAPITLEIDETLFPDGAQSPAARKLIEDVLPQIQERARARIGVAVPGASIRPQAHTDQTSGEYVISLRDVPVARGHVWIGRRLWINADPDRSLSVVPTPARGRPDGGAWVAQEDWAGIVKAGGELRDEVDIIATELESVVGQRLAGFVEIDTLDRMVDEVLATGLLGPDESSTLQRGVVELTRIARNLVSEEVPISDVHAFARAYADARSDRDDRIDVEEAVRRALVQPLAMNGPMAVFRLSEAYEALVRSGIRNRGGQRYLVLNDEEFGLVFRPLFQRFRDAGSNRPVFVTSDPSIRPFVQRTVRLWHDSALVRTRVELGPTIDVDGAPLIELGVSS